MRGEVLLSKQIDRMVKRHPKVFHDWWTEDDGYGEDHNSHLPSYWIHLHAPYLTHREVGDIHTKTVREALEEMKDLLMKIKGEEA